jgi:carbonic anhydrase
VSVVDGLLENNAAYAARYSGPRPIEPALHLAVVACMDSRLDVFGALGLDVGEAHVIRNAGGVVTADTIRSLAISQCLLGTTEIVCIHHANCSVTSFGEDVLRQRILEATGAEPQFELEAFDDSATAARESLRRIRESAVVPHRDNVRAFIFDEATGLLREITERVRGDAG